MNLKLKLQVIIKQFTIMYSVSEIGLTKNYVPKEQLQIEEVDSAEFMDKELALKCITKSQIPLIENLIKVNLL